MDGSASAAGGASQGLGLGGYCTMEIDRLYMSTHSECHTPTSPQEFNYKLSDSGARNLFTNNNMHGRDWLAS